MGLFNKEVELIPPKKHKKTSDIKVEPLNVYDAIREKIDEGNTLSVKTPVEQPTKPKTKISNWFVIELNYLLFCDYIY